MNRQEFEKTLAEAVIACGLKASALPSPCGHNIPVAVLYDFSKADFARSKPGSLHAGKAKLVCADCAPVFFKMKFRHLTILHLEGLAPENFIVYEVMSR